MAHPERIDVVLGWVNVAMRRMPRQGGIGRRGSRSAAGEAPMAERAGELTAAVLEV